MSGPGQDGGEEPRGQRPRRVAVTCESTACLPADLVERYAIGVVPIPFVFASVTHLDGVDVSPGEFYARLREARELPSTSPPTPGQYVEVWARASRSADAVVSVTVSGAITTFERSSRLAQRLLQEKSPGARVTVVDSRSAGMGQGFVTLAAARAAADGGAEDAVVAAAEAVARRVRLVVALDTLEYLGRATRLPQITSFIGGLIPIKPVIELAGGKVSLIGRPRTRHQSIDRLVEYVRQTVPASAGLHAAVQHAASGEEAAGLAGRLRETFRCVELYTTEFTPVMGAYAGPGLLGVAYYADDHEAHAE